MAYTELLYSVADGVATVTLHRPDKLNAFTNTMMRELHMVFDEIDADDNVRAVVMTGSGRGFCAGADLSGGGGTFNDGSLSTDSQSKFRRDGGGTVTLRMFKCNKPIIGAINGYASYFKFSQNGIRIYSSGNCPRSMFIVVLATNCWHCSSPRVGDDRASV